MKLVQIPEKTKLIQVLKEVTEWLEDPENIHYKNGSMVVCLFSESNQQVDGQPGVRMRDMQWFSVDSIFQAVGALEKAKMKLLLDIE